MTVPRFLPTWLGGEADRVDGGVPLVPADPPSNLAETSIRRLWPRRHDDPHLRELLRLVVRDLRLHRQLFPRGLADVRSGGEARERERGALAYLAADPRLPRRLRRIALEALDGDE